MASGIYKITSPSGKIYIGKSVDIEKRFCSYRAGHLEHQHKLRRSFNKYGANNHKFEIICTCPEEHLNNLEKYYIMAHNSFLTSHGLNLRDGGQGGKLSEESKLKLRNAHLGKPKSKEAVEKMRKTKSGKPNLKLKGKMPKAYLMGLLNNTFQKGHKTWNKGVPRTEEVKMKLSLANKGKPNLKARGKMVSQETREKLRQANLGKKYSDEINKKKGRKGVEHGFKKGHKNPGWVIELLSKRWSGAGNPKFGKPMSEETKAKLRAANTGRKLTQEHLDKIRETKKRLKQERLTMIF